MSGLFVTLPLHLACQLISPGNIEIHGNVTHANEMSSITLPDGYTAFPDVGVAYKYYENRLTWNAARKQCIAEGGNLAVIDSFKKVAYVKGIKDKAASIHIGVHRLFNNEEWISVKSGQSMGFIPWKSDAKLTAGTGDCVALWYDGSGLAPWICANGLPAVCEISLSKNHKSKTQICHRTANAETSTEATTRVIDRVSITAT